jgi:hypothetical protein
LRSPTSRPARDRTSRRRPSLRFVAGKPDAVILATGPAETGAVVGGAAAQGYRGKFIGLGPTWISQLNASPAAPALAASYLVSTELAPWSSDSPGHQAMRAALGTPAAINDAYTTGWAAQYPLKAALDKALAAGDLTRAGLFTAVKSLTSVDYEGMLPAGAGNYAGGTAAAVKSTMVSKPDKAAPTGISPTTGMLVGPTAHGFTPTKPCYLT